MRLCVVVAGSSREMIRAKDIKFSLRHLASLETGNKEWGIHESA